MSEERNSWGNRYPNTTQRSFGRGQDHYNPSRPDDLNRHYNHTNNYPAPRKSYPNRSYQHPNYTHQTNTYQNSYQTPHQNTYQTPHQNTYHHTYRHNPPRYRPHPPIPDPPTPQTVHPPEREEEEHQGLGFGGLGYQPQESDNDNNSDDPLDYSANNYDIPLPEKERLFEEVFKRDHYLYDKVINKFLPSVNRKRCKLRNVSTYHQENTLPQVCQLFNLKIITNNENSDVILRKILSEDQKEEKKKVRQEKKAQKEKAIVMNAQPISSDNIGHRMLAAMGWKQGETIGQNDNGLKEPILVVKRVKNRGLGA